MDALGIDWKIILVQVINFGLLVFVLNKFLYKPVMRAIKAKNAEIENIAEDKKKAESTKETAERERELVVRAAQKEKSELVKDARLEAVRIKKEAKEKADFEAKNMIEKAKKDIEAEKRALTEKFEKEVLAASFAITEKVIEASKKDVEAAHKKLGSVKSQLWRN